MYHITVGIPAISDPYITFRVLEEPEKGDCYPKQVVMQCNVQHNESIYLDVYWFVGEEEIKRNVGQNSIHYDSLPAELVEYEWTDYSKPGQLDIDVRNQNMFTFL